MTVAEILNDFPELTETDIRACFAYAADKERSQVVIYTNEAPIRSEPIRCNLLKSNNFYGV